MAMAVAVRTSVAVAVRSEERQRQWQWQLGRVWTMECHENSMAHIIITRPSIIVDHLVVRIHAVINFIKWLTMYQSSSNG